MIIKLYSSLSLLHVLAGFTGLLTFWLPMFAKKGGQLHRKIGKVFAYAMITAACSALLMSGWTLLQPLATHPLLSAENVQELYLFNGAFLGYLGLLSLMTARNGLTFIARKRSHEKHRNPLDISIAIATFLAAALSLWLGIQHGKGALIGLSFVGLTLAPATLLLFLLPTPTDKKAYLYSHIGNMVGAGIAAHTAFLAFGANRLFPDFFTSVWLWVTPSIIGTLIIVYNIRQYRQSGSPHQANNAGLNAQ